MTKEEAKEYAKRMTFYEALNNVFMGKSIPYKKATYEKLKELVEIAKKEGMLQDESDNRHTAKDIQ